MDQRLSLPLSPIILLVLMLPAHLPFQINSMAFGLNLAKEPLLAIPFQAMVAMAFAYAKVK